jgi:hypothetical protein
VLALSANLLDAGITRICSVSKNPEFAQKEKNLFPKPCGLASNIQTIFCMLSLIYNFVLI